MTTIRILLSSYQTGRNHLDVDVDEPSQVDIDLAGLDDFGTAGATSAHIALQPGEARALAAVLTAQADAAERT